MTLVTVCLYDHSRLVGCEMVCACLVVSAVSDSLWPMDCSPPGSSVHGILQARVLEWVTNCPPGVLPNPGTEPVSPMFAALQVDSSLLGHQGRPWSGILWLWLAFCWWLVILNIIFCSSFVYRLLKNVYPDPLVIFKLVYLSFYCLVVGVLFFKIFFISWRLITIL